MPRLTARQQRFVEEYLTDLNATAAAKRAGYSEPTARQMGSENLSKPDIQEALREAQARRLRTLAEQHPDSPAVDPTRTLRELAAVAFSDLGDLVLFTEQGIRFKPADQIPEAARRAVCAVKVKRTLGTANEPPSEVVEFKLWPKVEALKLLAQHLGLIKDDATPGAAAVVKVYIGTNLAEVVCPPQLLPQSLLPSTPTKNGHTGGGAAPIG